MIRERIVTKIAEKWIRMKINVSRKQEKMLFEFSEFVDNLMEGEPRNVTKN